MICPDLGMRLYLHPFVCVHASESSGEPSASAAASKH